MSGTPSLKVGCWPIFLLLSTVVHVVSSSSSSFFSFCCFGSFRFLLSACFFLVGFALDFKKYSMVYLANSPSPASTEEMDESESSSESSSSSSEDDHSSDSSEPALFHFSLVTFAGLVTTSSSSESLSSASSSPVSASEASGAFLYSSNSALIFGSAAKYFLSFWRRVVKLLDLSLESFFLNSLSSHLAATYFSISYNSRT